MKRGAKGRSVGYIQETAINLIWPEYSVHKKND